VVPDAVRSTRACPRMSWKRAGIDDKLSRLRSPLSLASSPPASAMLQGARQVRAVSAVGQGFDVKIVLFDLVGALQVQAVHRAAFVPHDAAGAGVHRESVRPEDGVDIGGGELRSS
jgi:hypothetical protein